MRDAFDALYNALRGRPSESNYGHWDSLAQRGNALIEAARQCQDADTANRAWHLTAVATARAKMCQLFAAMRDGKFKPAWVSLEEVEKLIESIERNAILEDHFEIRQLGEMVAAWQALYPYAVFASPEIIIRRKECTICGTVISPMRSCGHLPGYVYEGRFCSRRITDSEIVSIALVRDPVQKYSVLIPEPDPHDYALVRFALDRLAGPFNRWHLVRTSILHDHADFEKWSLDDNCPCHSGYRYADCCRLNAGVRLPHFHIHFEEPPPSELPAFLLRRRAHANGKLEDVFKKAGTP